VRFDDYWEGKPLLDELVVRFMPSSASRELAMRTGEVDSMRGALDAQLIERVARQGFVVDKKGPETVWYLHINTSVKPLDDIRVRKAIAHAINPADLRAFLGPVATISDVLIPPSYFGAAKAEELPAEGKWGYDPVKAKQLLGQAGHGSGINLSMIITERDDYRQMMVLMQEHLKRVGINVELNKVDHAFYHAQIVKNVNPLVLHGDLSFPNSEIFLNRFFRSDAVRNFSRTQDPDLDKFLDRIAAATTLEEKRKLLVEAQQRVTPQYRIIPTTYTFQPLIRTKKVDLGYELKNSLSLEYRYGWRSRVTA
jgi:peptide/nickel transport system substrate-binding protein